ncbi:MAG: amidohydrolase family protein [Symbiobacteriaceae bacterium]|nr:amidohydrolase family protein [Symbiobacteriaceae bacterium]
MLVKNGTLHLPGGIVQSGWDILTQGEHILRIGENLSCNDTETIDATGFQVFPGYILAMSSVGAHGFGERVYDDSETTSSINPHLDIVHSFDLRELKRQRFSRTGITSYGLTPGAISLIAGQMAFIHSDGARTEDVFIRKSMAMKANYTSMAKSASAEKTPRTHMALYFMLDDAFREAKAYMDKDKKDYDEKNVQLGRVLRGEIPFLVNAFSPQEIEAMLLLADKYAIRLVICGAYGIASCAAKVIEKGYHVILGDLTYMLYATRYGTDPSQLLSLYRQGLKLSLATSNDTAYPPGYEQLMWAVASFASAGGTPSELLEMITINPARALGVDDIVGTLEEGKLADIIVCKENPLTRYDAKVVTCITAGRVSYSEN